MDSTLVLLEAMWDLPDYQSACRDEDELGAARGIAYGLVPALSFWLIVVVLVVL